MVDDINPLFVFNSDVQIIIIIIIMTLFKEDNSVGQVQSSLRSSIKIHTFTIYTSEYPYVS